jgi:predicted molibdopterin-dependent oxidoreductase YjgC
LASPQEAAQAAGRLQTNDGPDAFAAILSAAATCEEAFLFKRLAETLGIRTLGFLTLERGERRVFKNGFTIEADKTPNRAFLEILFGIETVRAGVEPVVSGICSGRVKGLFVMNAIPDLPWPFDLANACGALEFLGLADILRSPLVEKANVVIPGAAWAEKDGTFVNVKGRVQRIRRAVRPPRQCRPEIETLQEMLIALGERKEIRGAEDVFLEAARQMPALNGLDYATIGDLGAQVKS